MISRAGGILTATALVPRSPPSRTCFRPGGGKVTEDYLKSQDGKQLFVIVNVQGARGRDIEFRRVYDATPSTPS
ncbi:MAG TPA: hypothetical protein VH137_01705 [Gemmatimonadales bacterium]|nr:hypothetical protein [Gemmatimonadales bacterium]